MRWTLVALLAACGARDDAGPGPGCRDPERGPTMSRLEDVTTASGVDFIYSNTDFRGGGLAVADLDGDDLPDIVAGRRVGGLVLFHNEGDLRFEQRSAGLDPTLAVTALCAIDLDNDGRRELVVATEQVIHIFTQADGAFREVARLENTGITEHILPVDLDGDGRLDLYLSDRDALVQANRLNRLYMNRGDLQFVFAGIVGDGLSWAATAFDFDHDGDQDIYVANDTLLPDFGAPGPSSTLPVDLLLRNDGVGADGVPQLVDIAAEMGLDTPRSSMGALVSDFNEDGTLDLYVPNLGAKKLFLGQEGAPYVEQATSFGVDGTFRENRSCDPTSRAEECLLLSWSAVLADLDLDSYDELIVMNGDTSPDDAPPPLAFTRTADEPFHEVAPEIGCMDSRTVVATDLDGDGDQDLVIAPKEGPLSVYKNRGRPITESTRVVLRGQTSNREGLGAQVTAHLSRGRTLTRLIGTGGLVHSSAPPEAFFGLGGESIVSLDVQWPSGRKSRIDLPRPGHLLVEEPP